VGRDCHMDRAAARVLTALVGWQHA
jgi:hypothetical protein